MKTLLLSLFFLLISNYLSAQDKPEVVVTTGHTGFVHAISFSPDGKYVATGGDDRTIRIWSKSLRQEYRVLYGHPFHIFKVRYSSDGKRIISVDQQGNIFVWNAKNGKLLHKYIFEIHNREMEYLPNSKHILTKNNNELQAIHYETGKTMVSYGPALGAPSIAVDQQGKYVFMTDASKSGVVVFDSKTGEELYVLPAGKILNKICVSQDGNRLGIFDLVNKKIAVWDVPSQKMVTEFSPNDPYSIVDIEFNHSADRIFVADRQSEVSSFNAETGKLDKLIFETRRYQRAGYFMSSGFDLQLSYDGKILALCAYTIGKRLEDYKGIKQGQLMSHTSLGPFLLNPNTGEEFDRFRGYHKVIEHLQVDESENFMLTYNSVDRYEGIRVWDLKNGELERYIQANKAFSNASGDHFVALEYNSIQNDEAQDIALIKVYKFPELEEVFQVNTPNYRAAALNADASILAIEMVKMNAAGTMFEGFYTTFWNTKTKKKLISIKYDMAESSMMTAGFFRLSDDGKYLLLQSQNNLTTWSVETGQKLQQRPIYIGAAPAADSDGRLTQYERVLDFVPGTNQVLIGRSKCKGNLNTKGPIKWEDKMAFYTWDYVEGLEAEEIITEKLGTFLSGHFSPDGAYLVTGQTGYFSESNFHAVLWDWATKKPICTFEGHTGGVKKVWFGASGKRVYSVGEDGFVKVWDIQHCKLAASFIAMNKLDYLILSPDNYYKASKGNYQGIGFCYNDNLYDFDQFDVHYNRPDKVMVSLGMSKYATRVYTKAWEKRMDRMGFVPSELKEQNHLPSIQILEREKLPVGTDQGTFSFVINAEDTASYLNRISISINDVPAPTLRGHDLQNKKLNQFQGSYSLQLSEGKNRIKVSVFNEEGFESVRESFDIKYSPQKASKPKLYMLGIGVSEFEDKDRNLQFAKNDVEKLKEVLEKSNYFDTKEIELVTNHEATRANIIEKGKLLKKASVDDVVLIYISSHGLLNEQLDYYLATHDVDFDSPTDKGLAYEEIDKMLDGIPCRNRLVMIDACHSGEIDKTDTEQMETIKTTIGNVSRRSKSGSTLIRPKAGLQNSFSYMQQLFTNISNSTGATVIAAAGGYEFALESGEWGSGNGVFTYSVIKALSDKNADLNNDGFLSVSELKTYITSKVIELTNGEQRPTTRQENARNDFIISERELHNK